MVKAKYFNTFDGYDYYRDKSNNIYVNIQEFGEEHIFFCSNSKGPLTVGLAEPYYEVHDVILIKEVQYE